MNCISKYDPMKSTLYSKQIRDVSNLYSFDIHMIHFKIIGFTLDRQVAHLYGNLLLSLNPLPTLLKWNSDWVVLFCGVYIQFIPLQKINWQIIVKYISSPLPILAVSSRIFLAKNLFHLQRGFYTSRINLFRCRFPSSKTVS